MWYKTMWSPWSHAHCCTFFAIKGVSWFDALLMQYPTLVDQTLVGPWTVVLAERHSASSHVTLNQDELPLLPGRKGSDNQLAVM